MAEALYYILTL